MIGLGFTLSAFASELGLADLGCRFQGVGWWWRRLVVEVVLTGVAAVMLGPMAMNTRDTTSTICDFVSNMKSC